MVEVGPGQRVEEIVNSVLNRLGILDEIQKMGLQIVVLSNRGERLRQEDIIDGNLETLHLMPPSSGGEDVLALVAEQEDPNKLISQVLEFLVESAGEDSDVGAVLLFVGVVRGVNQGKRVNELFYEDAGELTEKKLSEIALEALKAEGVRRVAAIHYKGSRRPGDVTMVVGVAGASRKHVFPVLSGLIERIKHELPIWKLEKREDGDYYIFGDKFYRKRA
ncbi:MAG: molybdenum cofactor biosynthesis protein MoaE [Desulfurococcales archaeon]|nr:molybdenum cofactor biosynthesis protein MoaE [Desulfurococcales archaeon]